MIIGSITLDGGLDEVHRFVNRFGSFGCLPPSLTRKSWTGFFGTGTATSTDTKDL
jgi:hypothetical protein